MNLMLQLLTFLSFISDAVIHHWREERTRVSIVVYPKDHDCRYTTHLKQKWKSVDAVVIHLKVTTWHKG